MSLIHRGHETEAKSAKAPCVSLAAEEDCEEAVVQVSWQAILHTWKA